MALAIVDPAACTSRITGRTLAAKWSAVALRASLARALAQSRPARPGGLQRGLDALRDHNPLVLRDGREDVQRQPVGVRVVDGDELDAGVHQGGDEGEIAPVWQ
jgi:hypothetical protein